jgi:tetratricopeptide (TPR) repeat protein
MSNEKKLILKETFDLAVQNHQNNKLNLAQDLYGQILKIDPDYVNAHYNLGIIFKELREIQKAIGCYEKVIAIDPNYVDAHYNLGIIFKELDEYQKAKGCFEKSIKINPNYVNALNNLGTIFKELGEYQKAKGCFEKLIKIDPNYVDAHYNLGVIFQELGEFEKAKNCYEKAISIDPNYVDAHYNLGTVFFKLKEFEKAKNCYEKIIAINPNSQVALFNRGKILFEQGEFELSLIDFDNCNTFDSRAWALTSLYALGHIDEIYKRIEENSQLDEKNIRVAAFSSFIAYKKKKSTAQNFCPNPIDFIHNSNLSSHLQNFNSFIKEIIKELHNVPTVWEPFTKTTIRGFQSKSNLFIKPQKKIQNLKSIIITEIESYYLKFKNENCSFIKKWPSKYDLTSWFVILKKQGHQNPHIHPAGWLSGVIYLKVVPSFKKNEGAIEFGLNGNQYYDAKSPKVVYSPKAGDIVLFPSSLHHRTIPFSTDTDRISIAFDLLPNLKKRL